MIRVRVYFRRWWCFFTDLRRVRLFLLDLRRRDFEPPLSGRLLIIVSVKGMLDFISSVSPLGLLQLLTEILFPINKVLEILGSG